MYMSLDRDWLVVVCVRPVHHFIMYFYPITGMTGLYYKACSIEGRLAPCYGPGAGTKIRHKRS